jgi:hypothetical protein
MNDQDLKDQAQRVRDLAEKADPFIKKRLLDLADKYDARLGLPSKAVRELWVVKEIQHRQHPNDN